MCQGSVGLASGRFQSAYVPFVLYGCHPPSTQNLLSIVVVYCNRRQSSEIHYFWLRAGTM